MVVEQAAVVMALTREAEAASLDQDYRAAVPMARAVAEVGAVQKEAVVEMVRVE